MLGNREGNVISAEHSKGRLKTCNFSFQTTFRHLSLMEIHIIRNSGRAASPALFGKPVSSVFICYYVYRQNR